MAATHSTVRGWPTAAADSRQQTTDDRRQTATLHDSSSSWSSTAPTAASLTLAHCVGSLCLQLFAAFDTQHAELQSAAINQRQRESGVEGGRLRYNIVAKILCSGNISHLGCKKFHLEEPLVNHRPGRTRGRWQRPLEAYAGAAVAPLSALSAATTICCKFHSVDSLAGVE